ncbi:MAG: LysR family transcriptional regulator [Cellulomonas sp.]|nr:LysR family transcriptional regulator [Cellulomonas sp.]
MPTPDLRALRLLTTIGAAGSLSAASRELGTSQQAVSARLRALESELGLTLASRSARGTQLTPTGLLVAGWADDLLTAADAFGASLATLRAERTRGVRVAASLTVAEHLLPAWLVAVSRAHPGLGVQVVAANSTVVIEQVRAGAVDLGLIETPDVPADLGSRTIGHDELAVVVAPGHRWARRRRIRPDELAATPLLHREEGSGTRRALEVTLAAAGYPELAPPAAVLTSTLALRTTAAGGLAPAALSARAVADDVAAGRLVRVRVDGVRIDRPLSVVWLGTRPDRGGTRDLLDVIGNAPGGR